jgi:hypothetical protein
MIYTNIEFDADDITGAITEVTITYSANRGEQSIYFRQPHLELVNEYQRRCGLDVTDEDDRERVQQFCIDLASIQPILVELDSEYALDLIERMREGRKVIRQQMRKDVLVEIGVLPH